MNLHSDLKPAKKSSDNKRLESGETGRFKFNFGKARVSRTSIINHLARRIDARSYLEIGVRDGLNFREIEIPEKTGVDPTPNEYVTHQMTSNEFFSNNENQTFDIVFIDGLHLEDFVVQDIENSLKCLRKGGFIVLHDCNPPTEFHQRTEYEVNGEFPAWNGTVWRGWLRFRTRWNLSMHVVDTDYGVGVIRRGLQIPIRRSEMAYSEFAEKRKKLLPLISVKRFLRRFP